MNPFERKAVSMTPGGAAALQANDLAKKASAAKTLSKAKRGDPRAKAHIVRAHKMAKGGNPHAKEAVSNLHFMNKLSKLTAKIDKAYKGGVSGAYSAGIED